MMSTCKRLPLAFILSALLLVLLAGQVSADNETQPISIFRSRPDLEAPILTIIDRKPDLQAPGYYFLAPYQTSQEGVYIYDNDANLVYSSFGSDGSGVSHSPRTCQYNGRPHLCFYQGRQMTGWGHGHGVIMDEHYRIVKSVEPSGSYQASSDMHEFMVIENGKTALMTQYVRSVYDLCVEPWNLCDGLGYIQSGVFQEVDIDTGKSMFEWNSLHHVDPRESWVPPSSTEISGSGEHPSSPWDYFHINSIDKNEEGDYLISARHCSALYKISRKDGRVLWRLNGMLSDYTLMDDLTFSSQHDARFVSDNKTMTVLSLYDNASNGFNVTRNISKGLIIAIDHIKKEARAVHEQDPPPGTFFSSRSQGSFQILPNGNKILGYGNDAFFSEHNSEGEVAFYGSLALTSTMNYRVHKSDDWVGRPLNKPAVWTYSKYGYESSSHDPRDFVQDAGNDQDPKSTGMTIYISWNGATEVKSWRVFGSISQMTDSTELEWLALPLPPPKISDKSVEWAQIAVINKQGFETIYKHLQAHRYTYIEALDKDNSVLGRSNVQELFVPNPKMRDQYCDDLACHFMPSAEDRERMRTTTNTSTNTNTDTNSDTDMDVDDQANVSEEIPDHSVFTRRITIAIFMLIGILLVGRWTYMSSTSSHRRPSLVLLAGKVRDIISCIRRRGRGGLDARYKALRLDEVLEVEHGGELAYGNGEGEESIRR